MRGEEPGGRGLFSFRMDVSRQRTLETLVELALGGDMGDCYDSERAEALLRSQSSEEELSALKVDPSLIARLWPRLDAR